MREPFGIAEYFREQTRNDLRAQLSEHHAEHMVNIGVTSQVTRSGKQPENQSQANYQQRSRKQEEPVGRVQQLKRLRQPSWGAQMGWRPSCQATA